MTKRREAPIGELSALRRIGMERVAIGHALVDNCTAWQACATIISHARAKGRPTFVATANAQHIVLLNKDSGFREIYRQADLVVADGMSLLFAARLYRRSLQQRVTGVDMFCMLCGLAAQQGLRVFLLGGLPGSAELAGVKLKTSFPDLKLASYCPPVGFEKTTAGLRKTADAIRAAKPDLLFVALGAPKQEYWIYEHGLELSVPVSIGVGGSFELVAGVLPRAPQWLQQSGFEWLYRLCQEPRRMWRRYLVGNAEFAAMVLRQCFRRAFLDSYLGLVGRAKSAAELRGFRWKPVQIRPVDVVQLGKEESIDLPLIPEAPELDSQVYAGAGFASLQSMPPHLNHASIEYVTYVP